MFWEDRDFQQFQAGSRVNGVKVDFAFRVLTEDEYQLAKECVNMVCSEVQAAQPIPYGIPPECLPSGDIQVHYFSGYTNERTKANGQRTDP